MRIQDVFKELPTLETERLLLRKLTLDDVKDLFDYGCDPAVTRYTTWDAYEVIGSAKEFLGNVIARYEQRREAPWGIAHKGEGRLIGTCGFDDWSVRHNRAEISYALAHKYWGQGLATEAVRAAIQFGFLVMGLNRIDARCVIENTASARVMEKIGMKQEGVLRQHMFIKGGYHDVQIFSLLREEWGPRNPLEEGVDEGGMTDE